MALIKKPLNGMKDILPEEMAIRDYLIGIIKEVYRGYGFTPIETPAMEHIENLLSKQGGDNEKLIFKVLKRGEKLNLASAETESDLTDSGLRYDLTLPLARFYSNNLSKLSSPFKALQVGSVWRADRPQKGRFRQFAQCDIDILGDESNLSEIELILATTQALSRLCPQNKFKVKINDRRILKAMVSYAGIEEEFSEKVLIILDKMDKIGIEGVKTELEELGIKNESIEKYISLFSLNEDVKEFVKVLNSDEVIKVGENLSEILEIVSNSKTCDFELVFDSTLVRGMGYYTGTIFEVSMEGFSGAVAGGGRYDKMIGKFTGKDTPACGFSIGFERIMTILTDLGFSVKNKLSKKAFLFEKGTDTNKLLEILDKAKLEREKGHVVLVAKMNKNKKFQKEQLLAEGYEEFLEFYREALK